MPCVIQKHRQPARNPEPASKDLDEPHLNAEDLEREIGDSEAWDEASEKPIDGAARSLKTIPADQLRLQIDYPCGVSHAPDSAERKTASITAMFLIASVERNRHLGAFAHGFGKDVALNRVLVASREGFYRNAATDEVPPVIDKNAARPVIGCVEGDLDFDTALGSQNLHSLVRDKLRAAGKRRMARWELENGGGQPVHLKLRVVFHQA